MVSIQNAKFSWVCQIPYQKKLNSLSKSFSHSKDCYLLSTIHHHVAHLGCGTWELVSNMMASVVSIGLSLCLANHQPLYPIVI